MTYLGDFALGDTLDFKFTTVSTAGVPTTLAGSPVISAYPGNSTTELTAGITLSVDFDSRTGMHNVRIVATSGNGYATATNYAVVITTGTVSGASVVGYVVGHFSIEARSALRPTTAARTLDVSATGEAGVDWANVGSPTTTVGLSGTTVKTATDVETDTQDIQTKVGTPAGASVSVDIAAVKVDTAAVKAKTDNLPSDPADASDILTATNAIAGYIDTEVGAIKAKTDNLPAAPAAVGDIPTAVQNADALLKRDWTSVTGEAARSALNALRILRNKWSPSGADVIVTKEDDTTEAWRTTVTTSASAEPITSSDPTT